MRLMLACVTSLALCAAPALGEPARQKATRTGTLLKRDAAARLSLPADKTYGELSDADKLRLRGLYENMEAGDEPPFPARGYGRLVRAMAAAQRELGLKGAVDMGVVVGADGRANEIKVYGSPDPRLTTLVANVLVLEQYKPALCDGVPCIQEFPFRASFTTAR